MPNLILSATGIGAKSFEVGSPLPKKTPAGYRFVTVLPDGTEVAFSTGVASSDGLDDGGTASEACREIALRVEMLSRGLMGRMASPSTPLAGTEVTHG